MEFLQLKYFCDAAETENFSRTAKKYLVPTSNISRSIKCLERELGCELFEHRANKVTLNYEGKQFYEKVSAALSLLESASMQLADRNNTVSGDIRLVCMSTRKIVTEAIEKFIKRHPKVNFSIYHNLNAGKNFDIFISDTCPYEYSEKILLLDEKICVALNKDHPLAERSELSVSDLERERFIVMTAGNSLQKITANVCADAGFTPNIAIQTDDPFFLRKYIEMGLGISLVPTISWSFPEDVLIKPVDELRRRTYAFLPKNTYIKRCVRLFLEVLRETMSQADNDS